MFASKQAKEHIALYLNGGLGTRLQISLDYCLNHRFYLLCVITNVSCVVIKENGPYLPEMCANEAEISVNFVYDLRKSGVIWDKHRNNY